MSIDDLKAIFEAKLSGQKEKLFELSLSRIMQHANKAKEEGFAILTSWRQANDKASNVSNFQALQSFIREKGLGYIQLRGHWQECQDPNVDYAQCPKDQLKDSVEPSLMVFKIDLPTAMELGRKFDQDAVVYAGPETGGMVQLHFKNGETMDLGAFDPMAIGQAYSEYRSKQDRPSKDAHGLERAPRHFKFEGHSYPAQSFMEKLIEESLQKHMKLLQEGISVIPSKK